MLFFYGIDEQHRDFEVRLPLQWPLSEDDTTGTLALRHKATGKEYAIVVTLTPEGSWAVAEGAFPDTPPTGDYTYALNLQYGTATEGLAMLNRAGDQPTSYSHSKTMTQYEQ